MKSLDRRIEREKKGKLGGWKGWDGILNEGNLFRYHEGWSWGILGVMFADIEQRKLLGII